MSPDAAVSVRIGRHDCYDRVVLSLVGDSAVGVSATYVSMVRADPSYRPLPVAGGAVLQLTIRARSSSTGVVGAGAIPARVGDYVYPSSALTGWGALRAIRLAGNFEGVSNFAIGVRTRLPFRLSTFVDGSTHHRLVVLDIAHPVS